MKIYRQFAMRWTLPLLPLVFLANNATAQKGKNYGCSEPNPAQLCNASNTCGSASTPCVVDVKREGMNSASSTPSIPKAKGDKLFCVQVGTKVEWKSTSKNVGFVLDFGPSFPFDPPMEAVTGGSDRPITVVAKKPGCYNYSAGACVSGSIYGMCGSSETELVVIPAAK